jgi:hypothetical protein
MTKEDKMAQLSQRNKFYIAMQSWVTMGRTMGGLLVITVVIVILLLTPRPAAAVVDCNANSWSVGSEDELNAAIACFNAKSTGSYTIALTADINLLDSSTFVDSSAGLALLIDGADYAVSGGNISGVRPFTNLSASLTLQNITIMGGNTNEAGGGIGNSGILTIINSTIRNNASGNYGGGIENSGTLTITNSVISSNFANSGGGGIDNFRGTLTVTNSTVNDNNTDGAGGGIHNDGLVILANSIISSNFAKYSGGGLDNFLGTLTITNSTVNDNNTDGAGGGVRNDGTVTFINSTISNNRAEYSGGIYNLATAIVLDSTISSNSAGFFANGIYSTHSLTLKNNIFANTFPGSRGDCVNNGGTITDNGYNLIEDSSTACGLSNGVKNNIIGQNPLLGPLADNGGPTLTHALLPGSPAINAGNSAETTDQRGVARPVGLADDIGALEQQYVIFLPVIIR